MKARTIVLMVAAVGVILYGIEAERGLKPLKRVTSRGGESCRLVEAPGLVGAEDMEFDHTTGTLWIAAANRRGDAAFRPHDSAVFRWKLGEETAPVAIATTG